MSLKNRTKWRSDRLELESSKTKRYPLQTKTHYRFDLFGHLARVAKFFLKILYPIYFLGKKNAKKLKLNKVELSFSDLPKNFDNYKILHLSDLHLDERPEMVDIVLERLRKEQYDICLFTGDYFSSSINKNEIKIDLMEKLLINLTPKFGHFGVLGNHDSANLVDLLESKGLKLLINEEFKLIHGNDQISLIGTDDVHYFYTPMATKILSNAQNLFSIVMVHSPELYDCAEQNGANLYLCGHTHGGQVRLTNKIPFFRRLKRGKKYFSGLWKYKKMFGYTSNGVGTSTIPIRFNCSPEISIITLKKSESF